MSIVKELLVGINFKVNKGGFDAAENAIGKITALMEGLWLASNIKDKLSDIIAISDEWKVAAGQIRNVTNSEEESLSVQEKLYQMAQRTRQEYKSTTELFASVARNSKELGKSQEEILAFTQDVQRAMLLGGGSAESQKAALIQLGQALGSGTLRGDELNSIMEQAPVLAKTIAEGMGTSIGHLRELGAQGAITSQKVFDAIRANSSKLESQMGNIPWTYGQAMTRLSNATGRFFNRFESGTKVVEKLAKAISMVADYIDKIDVKKVALGFRLLLTYATAFVALKGYMAIIGYLRGIAMALSVIKNGYTLATIASVVFGRLSGQASMKAALATMIAYAKIILITAAIAVIILLIQDIYKWMNGGKSVMGEWLGTWDSVTTKASEAWAGFCARAKQLWNDLMAFLTPDLSFISGILDKISIGSIGNIASDLKGQIFNSGNNTNNVNATINIAGTNASPAEISGAVADGVGGGLKRGSIEYWKTIPAVE